MIDARKANPGTDPPSIIYLPTTKRRTKSPKIVSENPMMLASRHANVRMQIIIDRNDDLVLGGANATEQCVVLTIIPHQVDSTNEVIAIGKLIDDLPASIATAVVDKDDLECRCVRL